MKTGYFGFGSLDRHTHLDARRSVLRDAFAMVGPALLCMFVIACAILQPYSASSQPANRIFGSSGNNTSTSSDTCEFGDASCIARQSQFQVEQADFLSRQYVLIFRNAQVLEANRASLGHRPTLQAKARLHDLAMRVRVMTVLYNAHASGTDSSLLSEHHLPAQLAL